MPTWPLPPLMLKPSPSSSFVPVQSAATLLYWFDVVVLVCGTISRPGSGSEQMTVAPRLQVHGEPSSSSTACTYTWSLYGMTWSHRTCPSPPAIDSETPISFLPLGQSTRRPLLFESYGV